MQNLKLIIAKILVNKTSGKIISFLCSGKIRFNGLLIDINSKEINKKVAAALWFKTYESSEIRFVAKYISGRETTILELGGSIGVMSTYVAKLNPKARVVSIEADDRFIPVINNNYRLNGISNAVCFNEIIGAEGYKFVIGDSNTTGAIVPAVGNGDPTMSLEKILVKYDINHSYVLICDIEGAEYFILQEDDSIFLNCELLIIELHYIVIDNNDISIDDMIKNIEMKGFYVKERHGGNIVAQKL